MPVVSYPPPCGNQIEVVNAPLAPMSVIACAGSGKTLTAVHRLASMSRMLVNERSRTALLSFSNVAVETFRQGFRQLTGSLSPRNVEITTLDSFLATNILKPHAHRTMRCNGVPFLISGNEQFLAGFSVPTPNYPICVTEAHCERVYGEWQFFHIPRGSKIVLSPPQVLNVVRKLGAVGAYTHNLGRFWSYETLVNQPDILRSLANRYKHIIIDEAQDLGTAHQALLELLISQGVQISLIGDPNQAIYEFIGANGNFLRSYHTICRTALFQLTENRRSLLPILAVANLISGRNDTSTRELPVTHHGAFYTTYRPKSPGSVIDQFAAAVTEAGLRISKSAVLCRANTFRDTLKGEPIVPGVGIVSKLAEAAIHRDILKDYSSAYLLVLGAFSKLIKDPPRDFWARLTSGESTQPYRKVRQLLWGFATRSESGLPSIQRLGKKQWHPELMAAVKTVLLNLDKECGFQPASNLGQKLAMRKIPDGPLSPMVANSNIRIRVDTVHQAKGESLDAVLYFATKEHAEKLLEGVGTEIGRIGYVALTRARNLFWIAVPSSSLAALEPSLRSVGLVSV